MPNGRSYTSRSLPSPRPHTRRSPPVGTYFRCFPKTLPSAPIYRRVLKIVEALPSTLISLTPMATVIPALLAASQSRSVAGPGIAMALRCSAVYSARSGWVCAGGMNQVHNGYAESMASGNTARSAPAAPASEISRQTFSSEASRSRNTGAAWTAATVKGLAFSVVIVASFIQALAVGLIF